MNEEALIKAFIGSVAVEARAMPVTDARNYLRGLLLLVGDTPHLEPLRAIHRHLDCADDQLELIAEGQLKLKLGGGDR